MEANIQGFNSCSFMFLTSVCQFMKQCQTLRHTHQTAEAWGTVLVRSQQCRPPRCCKPTPKILCDPTRSYMILQDLMSPNQCDCSDTYHADWCQSNIKGTGVSSETPLQVLWVLLPSSTILSASCCVNLFGFGSLQCKEIVFLPVGTF